MSHELDFHPKDGIGPIWKWVQEVVPKLRNRSHTVEIKEAYSARTNTINAYYWKIVVPAFMTEMGLVDSDSEREYIHYDVLGQELRQIPDPNRKGKTMTQRTSTMSGSDFWKYLDKCNKLFYTFFNYTYPPPKNLGYDVREYEDV